MTWPREESGHTGDRLAGALTISNLFDLQKKLRSGVWRNTIVEMLGVPYMDSAAMGVIISFYVSC